MILFLKNHWDEVLSVLAIVVVLLPPIIKLMWNYLCKLRFVFLDKHIVYNATGRILQGESRINCSGCIMILALNIFLYEKSFFPHKVSCKIKMKNGSKIYAPMFEGGIAYTDTNTPPRYHEFQFPNEYNMNLNRVIESNKDNLRIIPFFLTDVNLQSFENIEKITIYLKGNILSKKIVFNTDVCVNNNFISQYDKINT